MHHDAGGSARASGRILAVNSLGRLIGHVVVGSKHTGHPSERPPARPSVQVGLNVACSSGPTGRSGRHPCSRSVDGAVVANSSEIQSDVRPHRTITGRCSRVLTRASIRQPLTHTPPQWSHTLRLSESNASGRRSRLSLWPQTPDADASQLQ